MARVDQKTPKINKYYLGKLNIPMINRMVNDYLNEPQ